MKADGDPIPSARSPSAIKADPSLADDLDGAVLKIVDPALEFFVQAK